MGYLHLTKVLVSVGRVANAGRNLPCKASCGPRGGPRLQGSYRSVQDPEF